MHKKNENSYAITLYHKFANGKRKNLTISLPQRHKDTKGHKGQFFFIPKIKPFCVSLCLCALVAKIRRLF
jgi:hypothetical protein